MLFPSYLTVLFLEKWLGFETGDLTLQARRDANPSFDERRTTGTLSATNPDKDRNHEAII